MKNFIAIVFIIGITLTVKAQSKSQQLSSLKEKNTKAYFNIIAYGLKWCDENDTNCRNKREELCLNAYNQITNLPKESNYNELALAISLRKNGYKVELENDQELNLIDYVSAYGDYETKYKNLDNNELRRLFPEFFVKN